MRIPYFHVDAFTDRAFGGNPAGVCFLSEWLPDVVLQQIAAENNLSETAFLVGDQGSYHLRWFTPVMEVDLCGHATLAPAHVLFHEMKSPGDVIRFQTKSGELLAKRRGDRVELNFPARAPVPCPAPEALLQGLGRKPVEVLRSRDFFAVFENEGDVASLAPDMDALRQLECLGVIATAPGTDADFVSRFFAPRAGIPEDPVTGSAHCSLIPYWAKRLGKLEMFARQISTRGGALHCRLDGDRVAIAGGSVVFSRGEITVS